MRIVLFFAVFLLFTSPNHAQDLAFQKYVPHIDSTFAEWVRVYEAWYAECADSNICDGPIFYESIAIPYRVDVKNTSATNGFSEDDVAAVVASAIDRSGYAAVPVEKHTGPVKDVLVLTLDVSDKSYELERYAEIAIDLGEYAERDDAMGDSLLVGATCNGSSSAFETTPPDSLGDHEKPGDLRLSISDFTFGSYVHKAAIRLADCYFEQKEWPLFSDFQKPELSGNSWYEWKYPNGKP